MYIEQVHVKNIRCFEDVELDFGRSQHTPPFVAVLGDNATGKTTLLKAIAMGLCDESSAAGLMKEADAGYIRRGESNGSIRIILRRPGGRRKYELTTTIKRAPGGEKLRQTTDPEKGFPWDELFVSAYGAGRSSSGTGDLAEYSVINAVYNLFNYAEGLQNPELSLLRIKKKTATKMVVDTLNSFLSTDKVDFTRRGITIDGIWGTDMPLRDLADGYKTGFLWLTDFLGWAVLRDDSLESSEDISGIVLIDELEQHLHPKWQESVVTDLERLFPKVQFIIGTHSPLIVSRIGGIGDDPEKSHQLIHLELHPENKVKASELPSVRGWRPDQILASPMFDNLVISDPEIDQKLREISELASAGSNRDESRYSELRRQIAQHLISDLGTTKVERDIQLEMDKALQRLADKLLAEFEEQRE